MKSTIKQKLGLRYNPDRFQNRALAFSFSNGTVKPSRVMLGCDGRFWVLCPADANKLEGLGYEYA